MEIEVFVGIPYSKWYKWSEQPCNIKNPFQNFRLTAKGFFLQVITQFNGEVEITVQFPHNVTITI